MDQDSMKHREDVMSQLDLIEIEIDRLKQLVIKQHEMITAINKYLQVTIEAQLNAKEKA
jgi:acyl-CoA hydrolase